CRSAGSCFQQLNIHQQNKDNDGEIRMSIENKVALVTGASRGIGKAIAESLLKMGAIVVGTATTEAGAQRISDYIQAAGGKGQGYCLNVTDPASVEQVMSAIQESFGTPLILVNNAGITRDNLM